MAVAGGVPRAAWLAVGAAAAAATVWIGAWPVAPLVAGLVALSLAAAPLPDRVFRHRTAARRRASGRP